MVEDIVSEVAGKDVLPIVKALKNKKNVSEFKLAESIKEEINITRNKLYRLYNNNLVTVNKKKDKLKGWYISYWTFNNNRIKYLRINLKKKKLERLKERISREENSEFFSCNNRCVRLDFERSTDYQYKCPECGLLLHQEDNSSTISGLKIEVDKIKKELKI